MAATVTPPRRRPDITRLPALAQAVAATQVAATTAVAATEAATAAALAAVNDELAAQEARISALEPPP